MGRPTDIKDKPSTIYINKKSSPSAYKIPAEVEKEAMRRVKYEDAEVTPTSHVVMSKWP